MAWPTSASSPCADSKKPIHPQTNALLPLVALDDQTYQLTGVYIYRLRAGEQIQVRKLLLLR